jgi:hypothetical protein
VNPELLGPLHDARLNSCERGHLLTQCMLRNE